MAKLTPALTLAVCLLNLSAASAQEAIKPVGKWERKIGKSHVTLTIEENRLHATFIGDKPCVIHADYALARTGVVYGVVTSIECDDEEDSAKVMFDAPFSCRFRIDEGALIVHDLKCHEVDSKDDVWNGRFKPITPTVTYGAVQQAVPVAPTSALYSVPPPRLYNLPMKAPTYINSFAPSDKEQVFQFYTGLGR